ncbi:MAG: hypothetical protein KIT02_04955 [Devosia sp.]|uniref:hypothetical protein n=1 Tax=Devosia sp. TaxID=1871048 RepID=UPI0024C6E28D|nr:hypothetical protein [Devosia sp.]UYO00566.1 MAG: hypothetical protein KIT02_04955 [Devosia sp.]
MRVFLATALVLGLAFSALPVALPAFAQDNTEIPPLPRPRPDRDAASTPTPPGTTAADAIQQVTSVPQPVTLTARITEDGAVVPEGLTWRIFENTADANGEVALVARADTGTANLEIPPGQYTLHVAYGNAQVTQEMSVAPGANAVDVVLDAGALRLNSAVTGDIAISPALLKFEIHTTAENGEVLIVDNLPPNEVVTLNAGVYEVVSRFGAINAVVRADLRVEPGQLTDATLYHHASEIALRLVSEAGGEAIADVEWTIKSSDGTTIFTDRGAFPSAVLSEGEYLVLAKLGDQVYNREIQVQSGGPREIEVLSTIY